MTLNRDLLYGYRGPLDVAFFSCIKASMICWSPGILIRSYPGHLISWSAGNFGWLDLLAPPPVDLDLMAIFAAGKAAKCPIKGDPHTTIHNLVTKRSNKCWVLGANHMQFCPKSYECVKWMCIPEFSLEWSFVFLSEVLFVPCCRLEILLFGTLLFHFWLLKLRPLFYFGLIKFALLRLVTARRYLVRSPCHNHCHCHHHHRLHDSDHHHRHPRYHHHHPSSS